tara:strand:- start:922 stop:1131 length:210 start_codon:yes stop_codon:yes gene_type:complete
MSHVSARRWRHTFGVLGIVVAAPFFAWVPLGLIESVPSLVEVFGVPGLRIPASISVAGLLMAAIGFFEW